VGPERAAFGRGRVTAPVQVDRTGVGALLRAALRIRRSGPLRLGTACSGLSDGGRLVWADAVRFAALLGGLPIRLEPDGPERMLGEVLGLARARGLATYDAACLDLAMRPGVPLASRDQRLIEAAVQGLSVISPPPSPGLPGDAGPLPISKHHLHG
jgi:hypothetical protein